MIFRTIFRFQTVVILAALLLLIHAAPLSNGNLTTLLNLAAPGEPHRISECFAFNRYPGLKPVRTQSCRNLVEYLAHSMMSQEPRTWAKGKAAGLMMPGGSCRITLTPHVGRDRTQTKMIMSTREIASYATWVMDTCLREGPLYSFGGFVWFEHLGFSATLVVLNLSSDDPQDHPWASK